MRKDVVVLLEEYLQRASREQSQREFAEKNEVPRTTLQHWLKRTKSTSLPDEVVRFFETPEGLAFLHRLVISARFVITMLGAGGIRTVCAFLELSGLSELVASGYGTQQKAVAEMEEAINRFGDSEKARLGEQMPAKPISVAQDETFHPQCCLVAIEPASNFILLEEYSPTRDADAWTAKMTAALEGLNVDVVQSTSDEGSGILRHVRDSLGAHHSPDVFHVQYEVTKGTSGPLASRVRTAAKEVERAEKQTEAMFDEWVDYEMNRSGPGRPKDYESRVEKTLQQKEVATTALQVATKQQTQAQEAMGGISERYHPYDLETGAVRTVADVSADLEAQFAVINDVATEAGLSQRCRDRIAKAHRVVAQLVATIAFFHLTVAARIKALGLTEQAEALVHQHLIPGLYVQLAATKAKLAERRSDLRQLADLLLGPTRKPGSPLLQLTAEARAALMAVALECAQLFQRSSSCVEGRNGHLAFRHHSLHQISPRKLGALTVVHNYYVKRADGTTAAERFFGAKTRDLFGFMLDTLDVPRWPAKRRRKAS